MTPSARAPQRLLDYLHGRRSDMAALLEALARAESPSQVPESQAAVQALLRAELTGGGYRVRTLRGRHTGGHLLAIPKRRRAAPAYQLLLGHCDTVWPIGTLEKMPVHRSEGKLYGPGVFDMKAGLVQAVFALAALRWLGEPPQVSPVLLINSDEEIGSTESLPYIDRLARRANRAFVMEPALGPSGKLKTARKGVGRFTVRVIGKAAHAGLDPEKGASAILELSHVVQTLFALNDPQKGVTVNVGTIDGGLRPNVVAPESRAEVDVRVPTRADAERIERAIHAIKPSTPGVRLEITGRVGRPPMEKTPGNRVLWELAKQAAEELGLEIDEGTAGGGSDGNSTSLYTPTLDGLGAVGDGAHALNEFVYIDRMVERASLLAQLLLKPPLDRVGQSEELDTGRSDAEET